MNRSTPKKPNQRFFKIAAAGLFFLFICWTIFRADMGQSSVWVKNVRHIQHGDKAGHFLLYGMLAFLVNLALNNRRIRLGGIRVLLGALLVGTFAILEEFTQIALPSRNFEWWDMVCDIAGIWLFSHLAIRMDRLLQQWAV